MEGATLKGSPHFIDYPDNTVSYRNSFTYDKDGKPHANKAFLFAEGVHDISITGGGTIDGSGDSPEFDLGNDDNPTSRLRPCMLLVINCSHIKLESMTLTNPAYWLQNYLSCTYLELKGLTIYNQTNYNQDGMDIDAAHVLIENCHIDADDDGICLKSHSPGFVPEDITIRNCSIASNCNAIKFGTASFGGLKHVSISHCTIQKASADRIRHLQKNVKFIDQPVTVISGIALESVDGAVIDHINISDVTMQDVQTPLFIVLGNRTARQAGGKNFYGTANIHNQPAGIIRNIFIKNITATSHSKMASSITGFPGHYVEHIHLDNIVLHDRGGGTLAEANQPLMENPGAYPENRMYGQVYPASGLFIRHVKDIVLNKVTLTLRNSDYRPSVIFDDVSDGKITGLSADAPSGNTAVIRLVGNKRIRIEKPLFKQVSGPLLQLKETKVTEVILTDFQKYRGWLIN